MNITLDLTELMEDEMLPTTTYPDPVKEQAIHDIEEDYNERLNQRTMREKLDVVIDTHEDELKDKLTGCFETSTAESMLNDTWITEKSLVGILDEIIIDYNLEL